MSRDPWYFQRWAREQKLGNATRKLILMSLATSAESNTGWCFAPQDDLAEHAECSTRTVSGHLKAMEADGLIERRKRFSSEGRRLADGFLLLAPGVTEWPDGKPITTGSPAPPEESAGGNPTSSPPEAQASEQERPSGTAKDEIDDRAGARQEPAAEFPDDLPTELHDAAIAAGKILKRTALTRGQKKPVTRAAVGHAVLTYPDRDHVQVARNVENWLLHGRGARKACADIVQRYRNFLETSDAMAGPPLPAGVTPLHGGRRLSNAETVDQQIRTLRGET